MKFSFDDHNIVDFVLRDNWELYEDMLPCFDNEIIEHYRCDKNGVSVVIKENLSLMDDNEVYVFNTNDPENYYRVNDYCSNKFIDKVLC